MDNKLYAVVPIYQNRIYSENGEQPPRFDLAPMNHKAACNWMQACRNYHTDYRLIEWPEDVKPKLSPLFAAEYRKP